MFQTSFWLKAVSFGGICLLTGATLVSGRAVDTPNPGLISEVVELKEKLKKLQTELAMVREETPPVGSIIGWHRNISNATPKLPDGWLPCDGREITEGPFKGKNTPNLNKAEENYAGGRFLRGGEESGKMQDATALFSKWEGPNTGIAVPGADEQFALENDGKMVLPASFDEVNNQGSTATKVPFVRLRPVNMSVIWIIRVR